MEISETSHVLADSIRGEFIDVFDNKLKETVVEHIEKQDYDDIDIADFNAFSKIYKVSEELSFEVVNRSVDLIVHK